MANHPCLALPTDTPPAKGTVIIDKNTNQVVSTYTQKSNLQPVSIYTIPQNLIQAVLTLEDSNFFQNPGAIPWSSILKVNLECLAKSSNCRGGSGIVQQLVKNVSGDDSPTFGRKINELFLSLKLSQKVSREVILEAYLNNVFYGQNSYGIQSASQTYFGHTVSAKDSSQKYLLSDSKACFLASLLQSPDIYSKSVFGENNSTSAFANRIDFCLKEFDSTDLGYFKNLEKDTQYVQNIPTQELLENVKNFLTKSRQSSLKNVPEITKNQTLANLANKNILQQYSPAQLQDNNWTFYLNYDQNLPINQDLPVSIESKNQSCSASDCPKIDPSPAKNHDFKLFSRERLTAYLKIGLPFLILLILFYCIAIYKKIARSKKLSGLFRFESTKLKLSYIPFDKQNFLR